MKAEINNENKAKLFALYWGQELLTTQFGIFSIDKDTFPVGVTHFLSLNPLSKISDLDKNELLLFVDKVLPISEKFATGFGIDFLRSRGYALPWMGLSVEEMVEAGWIKLD